MKKRQALRVCISVVLMLSLLMSQMMPVLATDGAQDEGLVAHWDFENVSGNSVPDASGNGHTGTIKGGAGTVAVKEGKALYLNGSQAVDVPYSDALKFEKKDNFTFSLWFNVDSTIEGGWKMLGGMGRGSQKAWYGFYYNTGNLWWSSQSNGDVTEDPGSYDNIVIAKPTAGQWNCVTVVHDGTKGESRCYYNGQLMALCAAKSNLASGEAGFTMGYSGISTVNGKDLGEYFKGQLDNIRVYERALTDKQIADLYNGDKSEYANLGATAAEEGLVAHWNFENVQGGYVPDASANGHTGTIKGGAGTVAVQNGKALSLNGSQAVDVPYSDALKFEKKDNFTFSLWFNVDSTIEDGWKMLGGMGRGSTKAWYGFYYNSGSLSWSSQSNGDVTEDPGSYDNIVIAKPTAGQWNCVTVVHDGTKGVSRCYYNGKLVSMCTANSNLASGEAGFTMGYSGISTVNGADLGQYFKGQLDNIRVYERALTDAQIAALYDGDKGSYATLGAVPTTKDYLDFTGEWPHPDGKETVKVIYDTDMAPDCDDAGALAMLHAYADEGLVDILACVCDTSNQYGAPCIDAINTYYGRPDIPIGTLKSKSNIYPTNCRYNRYIAQMWDNDTYNGFMARDAVEVYRETLAAAEDNSVTIIVVGMQTNLMDLLKSGPDEYSDLTGLELVKKKVKLVSAMAGGYPNITSECNVFSDAEAAAYVAENWPTPIMFSGFEVGRTTYHGAIRNQMAEDDPVRKAYDLYLGNTTSAHAGYDLTSVLYAVEGLSKYWDSDRGDVEIVGEGNIFMANAETGARAFLIPKVDRSVIGARLDELLLSVKKNNPDEPIVKYVDIAPNAEGVTLSGVFYKDSNKASLVYDGTVYYTNKTDATVTVEFVGSGIDLFGGLNKDHAKIEIYMDGKLVDTVDTYSSNNVASTLLYSDTDLPYGEHTLTVKNSGTRNDASTNLYMNYDYVRVHTCDHKYTVEVEGTRVDATCMAEGHVTMKCSVCGATKVQTLEVNKNNHTGNNTEGVNAKEPTCTEKGYTGDTVCECGTVIIAGEEIPATGEAAIGDKGYETFEEALAEAGKDDVVKLLVDVEVDYLALDPGVKLDLCGNTLTAEYVVGFNTSAIYGGTVKVAKDKVALDRNNGGYLPVYGGGVYKFITATMREGTNVAGSYYFSPDLSQAHDELAAGSAASGINVVVRLSWTKQGNYVATQDFVYMDEMVNTVVESYGKQAEYPNHYTEMFTAVFSGTEADTADDLRICAVLVSDTGVEIASAGMDF